MSVITPSVTPPVGPSSSGNSESPSSSSTSTTPDAPTPVPPTTTSTSTSTSSSSSTLPSSSSSTSDSLSTSNSATSSSSSSSSSLTTTSSTSRSSSSSTSVPFVVETSNGQVFTRTSFVTVSSTPTQSPTSQSPTGFFHNKGAMAGVFSVVGVIVIVFAFFLFTSYLRRRRAREFDREIDEAAAAAAAAQLPDFDDYDYNSAGGGYGHYSETSHGTLSQPPLSHDQLRNPSDAHGSYDQYAGAGAGAAGVGARGRSLRNGGQQDPYGAFANPPEQYEMYETGRTWQRGNTRGATSVPKFDVLQSAAMASSDPYAVTRGPSTRSGLSYGHSQSGTSGLMRSQSQGTSTLPTTAEEYPVPMPTPAPGYPGVQGTTYAPDEKARYSASYAPGGGFSTMPPDEDEDAYDGYQEQPPGRLDNPHSPGFAGPRVGEDADEGHIGHSLYAQDREEAARTSFADDEDYGYNSGQRVLRVANE